MEKKSFECLIESALFTRSFISQYSITPNDLSLQYCLVLSRLGKKKAMAGAKKSSVKRFALYGAFIKILK